MIRWPHDLDVEQEFGVDDELLKAFAERCHALMAEQDKREIDAQRSAAHAGIAERYGPAEAARADEDVESLVRAHRPGVPQTVMPLL